MRFRASGGLNLSEVRVIGDWVLVKGFKSNYHSTVDGQNPA